MNMLAILFQYFIPSLDLTVNKVTQLQLHSLKKQFPSRTFSTAVTKLMKGKRAAIIER